MVRKLFNLMVKRFIKPLIARETFKDELLPAVRYFPTHQPKEKISKNILHLNTLGNQGGAAKVAWSLNSIFNSKGLKSKMLVDQVVYAEENIELLPRVDSRKQTHLFEAQQNMGWQDFFHLSSFEIKNMEVFKQCDILHLHNLHGNYFSPFALPELTALKSTVWTLHDMQSITGHCAHSLDCNRWLTGCGECPDLNVYPGISKDTTRFLWETKKNIYQNSHLTIVCPSKWLKEKVKKSILGDKDIRLIYNGINEKVFNNTDKTFARKKLGLPLDKTVLLFNAHGGTGNTWKGGQYLFSLFEQIGHRKDVFFLNVGGMRREYKNGNWLDVPYVNNEEEMALYYSASDLFIYPSLADNCPLVVLEALACETPVISFRTGGIPELVEHLETGYIADYKDCEDFIKGVLLFLDNSELINRAGERGRLTVIDSFTVEKMAKGYMELYNEVLSDRSEKNVMKGNG